MDSSPRDEAATTTSTIADGTTFENNDLLITVWIFSFLMFVFLPFCASKYRRRLCLERIKQRRWDVPMEQIFEAHPPEWYRLALERYEAIRAAQLAAERFENSNPILSEEQEDEIRRLYLDENMNKFTMTLKETDLKDRDALSSSLTMSITSNSEEDEDLEKGSNDTDEDDVMPLQECTETDTFICIPRAGTEVCTTTEQQQEGECNNNNNDCRRNVPNGCAICLSEMEPNERITWASNSECKHVYHEECIVNWLLAVGRKRSRRRRGELQQQNDDDDDDENLPIRQAIDFPKLCPTCRRPFIKTDFTDTLPALATLTATSTDEEEDVEQRGDDGDDNNTNDVESPTVETVEQSDNAFDDVESPTASAQQQRQNVTATVHTRPASLNAPLADEN